MAEFEKGKSGNPKGRPKGIQERSKLIQRFVEEGLIDQAVETLKANPKDVRSAQWILEMSYGKAPQAVDHGGQIDLTGVKFGIDNTNKP